MTLHGRRKLGKENEETETVRQNMWKTDIKGSILLPTRSCPNVLPDSAWAVSQHVAVSKNSKATIRCNNSFYLRGHVCFPPPPHPTIRCNNSLYLRGHVCSPPPTPPPPSQTSRKQGTDIIYLYMYTEWGRGGYRGLLICSSKHCLEGECMKNGNHNMLERSRRVTITKLTRSDNHSAHYVYHVTWFKQFSAGWQSKRVREWVPKNAARIY